MARNKETLVLLVDIGPSMHPHLECTAKALSSLVVRKLVNSKHDEVGVVYFGANETDNELNLELGDYHDIVVSRPITVVTDELALAVEKIPMEYGTSDFLDAIVVGMDMIVKKVGSGSKGNKRIYLITDAEMPVKDPDEGTKEEQVNQLAGVLQKENIILDIIVIRLKGQACALESAASQENEFLLRNFASQTRGDLVLTENYTALLGSFRIRNISPTTVYRGDLELTPNMAIKIWVYKKVSMEKLPALKMFSDKAPQTDAYATHEVKMDTEYKSTVDLDVSIAPEQRIKAYKYGPQFIPISSKEEDALKFKTEKGIKVIGFTDASNIPRQYYMKETSVFVPEPGNTRSALAVSSLVWALKAVEKVAIVRCVWRSGQKFVVLGVLTPNPATEAGVADCFYFNIIPFSEDLREFPFASFKDGLATQQPSQLQQEAADALVQMMDLAPYPGEVLMPDRTVNPILQRFYSFLHLKSVNHEAEVPPMDNILRKITEPEERMEQGFETVLQQFGNQFTLTYNTQKDKIRSKFWKDRLENGEAMEGLGEEKEGLLLLEDGKPVSLDFLTGKKTEEVGSLNPVQDFEALLARRDSDQWIPKAIKGMKKIISDLLSSAYNGNTYEKALACLIGLRGGCVIQEEPSEFNSFLEEIAAKCRDKRQNDFWEQIIEKKINLISKDETPYSDVTQEEAASFLSGTKYSGQISEGNLEEEIDEMEALLDDVI